MCFYRDHACFQFTGMELINTLCRCKCLHGNCSWSCYINEKYTKDPEFGNALIKNYVTGVQNSLVYRSEYSANNSPVSFWLLKWLLFRLMFSSGVVKLTYMDKTWWNLTALNWHYESQVIDIC